VQEAVIGVVFIVAANAAILLLAANPHGAENLKDLLVGQILWVDAARGCRASLVYAVLLALWFGGRAPSAASASICFSRARSPFGAAGRPVPRLHDADRSRARHAMRRGARARPMLLGVLAMRLGLGVACSRPAAGPLIVCTIALLGLRYS
jgi:zinc/manganese transport system permease protein